MSDKKWNQGCALWYWHQGQMDYELWDSEEEAAKQAVFMVEYETGTPVGLQYSDGRTVLVEDWQALKAAQAKYDEEWQKRWSKPESEKRPTRVILNPFNGGPIRIDAEEPQWLGRKGE